MADVEDKLTALDAELAPMPGVWESKENVVDMSVGGVSFKTSVSTLRSKPGTMLDAMFSGRYEMFRDEGDRLFVDRDGALFIVMCCHICKMGMCGARVWRIVC